MLDMLETEKSKVIKYKQKYLKTQELTTKEDMSLQLAAFRILQHDFQLQKDELQQSLAQQKQLTKKVSKLRQKKEEMKQKLSECQKQLKSAITQRDSAIGEKYIIQKKYDSLQALTELSTEPSQNVCNQWAQDLKTEPKEMESSLRLNTQSQDCEQENLQEKLENSYLKQKLEEVQAQLAKCQSALQEQEQIVLGLRKVVEVQSKSVISNINLTKTTSTKPQEHTPVKDTQEQKIKQLIRQAQTKSYDSMPTLKDAAKLNQHILERQLINQIQFQQILLEQSVQENQNQQQEISPTQEVLPENSDLSQVIFDVLNISPNNQQISKMRIEKCFGKNQCKPKAQNRWF